jgi:hypothetical protein
MCHVSGRGEVHSRVWWESLKGRDHMKNRRLDEINLLKLTINKYDGSS